MKSIIQNRKCCWVCGATQGLEEHHVFYGKNRHLSEQDGLKVYLCEYHHRGTDGVHGKNGHDLDVQLKRAAEYQWIRAKSTTLEESIKQFRQRYGKNYLDVEDE